MHKIVQYLKYQYLAENFNNLKLLGIDFGIKKLGVAILHFDLNAALPLKVIIKNKSYEEIIFNLIKQHYCHGVVIGNCNNSINLDFVIALQKAIQCHVGIPVLIQDEQLTTHAANERLKDVGLKRKDREKIDDAIAAQLILESFLSDFKQYIYSK